MDPLMIAVMGATGSGKTTFINKLSSSGLHTSAGLKSCTDQVQEAARFQIDGRDVVLVDTPGFDDTSKTDTEILSLISDYLATSYQNGRKLSGLLFIHRISDVRMGGISTKNFRMFRRLCGESTLRNVVIVTNMWGNVDTKIGEARERELMSEEDFFKPALDKGATTMRHFNTEESARNIVRSLLESHTIVLQIQAEIVDEKKDLIDTAAADELDRQLKEAMEQQRLEMERMKAEAEAALRKQEEEAKIQREMEAQRAKEELERAEAERRRTEEEMRRQREEGERRIREEEEARQREAERIRRENEDRMAELRRRQAEEDERRWHEHKRLQRELEAERHRHHHHHHGGGCLIQ